MTDASPAVEVLGAAWCVDTARTLRCLRRLRVPFHATDVDDHLDALEEVTRLTGGERRTPVVRVGDRVLVEPSNAALVQALEQAGVLAPSTVHAFEHGQNIGRSGAVAAAGGRRVGDRGDARRAGPVRVPLRVAAVGLALTAAIGWCPVYDAQGVTSVGGPGDHPDEAEREPWWVTHPSSCRVPGAPTVSLLDPSLRAILNATHGDPFAVLGPHVEGGRLVIRTFLPRAAGRARDRRRCGDAGPRDDACGIRTALFEAALDGVTTIVPYRFEVTWRDSGDVADVDDPYRFGLLLGDLDLYLMGEGRHQQLQSCPRRASDGHRRRRRDALCRLGAERATGQRGRRLERVGRTRPPDAPTTAARRLGAVRAGRWRRRALQVRARVGRGRAAVPQGRPVRAAWRAAAGHRLGRLRREHLRLAGRRVDCAADAAPRSARSADLDLRGASRVVGARRGRRVPVVSGAGRPA